MADPASHAPTPTPAPSPASGRTAQPTPRQPGATEVLLVSVGVVAVVIAAAVITGFLPTDIQRAIFHAPVLIGVLIVGTGWLLWRISRGRPLDRDR